MDVVGRRAFSQVENQFFDGETPPFVRVPCGRSAAPSATPRPCQRVNGLEKLSGGGHDDSSEGDQGVRSRRRHPG